MLHVNVGKGSSVRRAGNSGETCQEWSWWEAPIERQVDTGGLAGMEERCAPGVSLPSAAVCCPRRHGLALVTVAFLLLLPNPCLSSTFAGRVVRVLDGDTSRSCTTNTLNVSVSTGSTARGKAKPIGSKPSMPSLTSSSGKKSRSRPMATTSTGAPLAICSYPMAPTLNQKLVKDGWCWWYRKYAPGDTVLEGLENEAREARKGLWVDPQPVPPWEWRKRK